MFKEVKDLNEARLLFDAGLLWWQTTRAEVDDKLQPAVANWGNCFARGNNFVTERLSICSAVFGVIVEE